MRVAEAITIAAVGQTNLGNADEAAASKMILQFVPDAFTGSITIQGRVTGSGQTAVAVAYTDLADGTVKTTAITGAALVQIDASGLDVVLDATAVSAGEMAVYARPVYG